MVVALAAGTMVVLAVVLSNRYLFLTIKKSLQHFDCIKHYHAESSGFAGCGAGADMNYYLFRSQTSVFIFHFIRRHFV